MALVDIAGHTIETSIIDDGAIIDIGCRGFAFADYFYFHGYGCPIYCVDPDKSVFDLRIIDGKYYINAAISNKSGESAIYINGEATCLKEIDPDQGHPFIPCKTMTMDELYEITGTNIDILKLDCEGAEYMILGESFKPIPKQISVEFHNHTVPEMHKANIDGILKRLGEHYNINRSVWEERHGCGFNFWDVLFIKK